MTAATNRASEPIVQSSPGRVNILVVDDSPENLVSMEATLASPGLEVVLANSGKEALRRLLDDDFAVILLDVKMPDMDGFETAELIRSRKRSRHTPILFLTAYKSDEHLFRGYDLGAVDFLFKPIIPEILRSKVNVFVDLSRNTSLLRAQSEVLAKAEQKFRSLLEAAPDSIAVVNQEGQIVLVNAQLEKVFGYDRQELLGKPVTMLVPLGFLNKDQLQAAGNPDLAGIRKNGSQFPVEITRSPLVTDEGPLAMSAIRDVTEQKKAVQQIRELNASLEQRVVERTSELMDSIEALRRSNEDLNQFVYAASHDLQEPLRLVALYSQMLQKKHADKLDSQAEQFLNYILNGALRMEELLKDLLTYSQLGSPGEGPLRQVSCVEVMRKVMLNLQASIEQNEAIITWNGLPTVEVHEIRLLQLFQNLVGNAIKYRRQEAPRIHVDAKRRPTDWLFSVEDNGIGFKPEYSQQIFGIFKRLHGNAYAGTGIGLAICQRIVESYGGRIWCDSVPGNGSTFYFSLPQPFRADSQLNSSG